MSEAERSSVLVLGEHGTSLSNLAERCRQLGYSVLRARTFEDAAALACRRRTRFGVALIDPHIPIGNLWQALRDLRSDTGSQSLTPLAVGPAPDSEIRAWLRNSDVQLGLWEPVGDHALRFQLNRAMAGHRDDLQRSAVRAPTEWPARIFVSGREKSGSVYSISNEGAFLETRRPSVTGARVALEVPLEGGAISIAGSVVYTNVPGNLHCQLLPHGMAVRFSNPCSDAATAIRECVSDQAAQFAV